MARARAEQSATECQQCCHPDMGRVNGQQIIYLQNLRHEHFLSFDNANELEKHLKFVHPTEEERPMIKAVLNWYRMKKGI